MGKCLLHEWPLWAVDSTLRHAVESLAAGYIGLDFAEDVGDLNRVTRDQLTQGKPYLQFAHDVEVASAIEALLNKDSERCKECGQPRFETTKKFGAFLKEHVPEIEKEFPDEFKAIYKMRSDLAHGNALLVADVEYWNYFGTPLQQWQDEFQRNTFHITATALRNWVLAR